MERKARRQFSINRCTVCVFDWKKNIFQYGNAACHIYMEVEYSELDSQRVEEVWNILINRHPMLRVIFSDTGIQKF